MNNSAVWKLAMLILQLIAILTGIGIGVWLFGLAAG
jgi:flagellar biogenesis protein FliO